MLQSLFPMLVVSSVLSLLSLTADQCRAGSPNVLILLADDLGWADLGCYGNAFNESPHLDHLATQGIRFTHFYAGPVCSPTRANLQTGLDQARFGITQHIPGHRRPYARLIDPEVPRQLPLAAETFAEHLSQHGYRTAYFGKWHLGGDGFGPQQQGWEEAIETVGHTLKKNPSNRLGDPQRTIAYLNDQAVKFMSRPSDRPFLIQISYSAVHLPITPPAKLLAKFEDKAVPGRDPASAAYAALLEELDQGVGSLMQTLEQLRLDQNTIVFFVSDNGGLEHQQNGAVVTSNRPLRGEKGTLYEGGLRVPALLRWPNQIPAGLVVDTPCTTQDWFPTLVELTQVPAPAQMLDGQSFAQIVRPLQSLRPSSTIDPRNLYWHLPHYHHSTPASAIRNEQWKLIHFFEDDSVELYYLKDDPSESNNVAELHPQQAESLKSKLDAWRRDVGARLPVINPSYDPQRADQLGRDRASK